MRGNQVVVQGADMKKVEDSEDCGKEVKKSDVWDRWRKE